MEFDYTPVNPFEYGQEWHSEIIDIINTTLSVCGVYGEDATIALVNTLKRLGRSDLLPPCLQ